MRAGEVTGSCYVVTTDRAQVMVDMGMHQGEREADAHNRRLPPIELRKLDAVVLTHAHLDHCGRLPMLVKNGYRGKIHCTRPTADITEVILRDSAHLQAEDYARFLRRIRGKPIDREPLYSEQDVERTLAKVIDGRLQPAHDQLPKESRSSSSMPATSWARQACRWSWTTATAK